MSYVWCDLVYRSISGLEKLLGYPNLGYRAGKKSSSAILIIKQ